MVLAVRFVGASDQAAAHTREAAPVPVSTVVVDRRDLRQVLTGVGTVQAFRSVAVRNQVDGQLLAITFQEGQEVRANDILARIDPRPYQAVLNQGLAKRAQDLAQLENAQDDLVRYTTLLEREFATRQQVESLRARVNTLAAAVKADDAAIDSARIQLDRSVIRAPIDGRVGLRQIDVGNILRAGGIDPGRTTTGATASGSSGDTIVTLTQMSPVAVLFTLPQDVLPRLRKARAGSAPEVVAFSRDGSLPLDTGRLEVIDNMVDPASGTVRLKAVLPNADGQLWPGQFVLAKVLVDTLAQVVAIPSTALLHGPQGDYAFVATASGTVEARPLVAGAVDGEFVEVVSGLEAGETVVSSGQNRLRPGLRIAARPAEAGTPRTN
jgi:multidrug efflux system membrane fusion protein